MTRMKDDEFDALLIEFAPKLTPESGRLLNLLAEERAEVERLRDEILEWESDWADEHSRNATLLADLTPEQRLNYGNWKNYRDKWQESEADRDKWKAIAEWLRDNWPELAYRDGIAIDPMVEAEQAVSGEAVSE